MDVLGLMFSGVGGLISLVCFILVVARMFQVGQSGLGITCLVLLLCCGIGGLVTFIVGWVNHQSWRITNVMIAWTAGVALGIIGGALNPAQFQRFQQFVPFQGP